MQNHGKIQILIVVIILNIVLAFVVAVLNFTYAEENLSGILFRHAEGFSCFVI